MLICTTKSAYGARDDEAPEFDPQLAGALFDVLNAPINAESIEPLYDLAVRRHGSLDPLFGIIDVMSQPEEPAETRRAAHYARALLLWRLGDLDEALEALDEIDIDALPAAERAKLIYARARLLDALDRAQDARKAYQRVIELADDESLEAQVRLRLALMALGGPSADEGALADFARGQDDAALRNRAAIVLALLKRPADSIDLFVVEGEGAQRFRAEIRVAEWSLRASDYAKAQESAWRAVQAAALSRDRHYAIAVLIEAYRAAGALDKLLERFSEEQDALGAAERAAWIDLLREMERYDEAIALLCGSNNERFNVEMRREMLEMYREAGRTDDMIAGYRQRIEAEPHEFVWRSGLSRFHIERGDRSAAEELWRAYIDQTESGENLLSAAQALSELGLDELSAACAEKCVASNDQSARALLHLYQLHKARGRLVEAEAALQRLDETAPKDGAIRFELAEALEGIGRLKRAIEVIEGVRAARGSAPIAEDLEMRLAWLYSEVGQEDKALERWRELWRKVNSIPRRRYVEDRMMTVASRIGKLADIAIELERKLTAGQADERDSGLLVRIYTRVNDSVSATEVIDEFLEASSGNQIEALQEKARVYMECTDYYNYEATVRRLIEIDPDGRGDYLRQLALSQLERGRPDEARQVLERLKHLETDSIGPEFEAGVLALAGMRDEAIIAYRKGLAAFPDRIESYLLLANLMRQTGQTSRAIGMFQYLAETADQDDLFTIAIDGLLNMEASTPVLQWARRITLERLTSRRDRNYLYQLLADLAEQMNDRDGMLLAMENSLPVSGARRPYVLRELMDLARGRRDPFGRQIGANDSKRHLAYGRRLIGLAEIVPPQVYLDLGEAFLKAKDARNAAKTFRLARDLPDRTAYDRQTAGLFERFDFLSEALETYERILLTSPSDVSLMLKLGQLQEQLGKDPVASQLYAKAIELLLSRQTLSTVKAVESKPVSPFVYSFSRNMDDFQLYNAELLRGLLAALPDDAAAMKLLDEHRARLDQELAEFAMLETRAVKETDEKNAHAMIARAPRILRRAEFCRRLAFAFSKPQVADEIDRKLLSRFPKDQDLLRTLCRKRLEWGYYASARRLLDNVTIDDALRRELEFMVGVGSESDHSKLVSLDETIRLFLPMLIDGKREEVRALLRRTNLAKGQLTAAAQSGVVVFGAEAAGPARTVCVAAQFLGDQELSLQLARQWLRRLIADKQGRAVGPVLNSLLSRLDPPYQRSLCEYVVEQVIETPKNAVDFVTILPELQRRFEQPLMSEEQILTLLESYGKDGWAWGVGPVLALLPEASRVSAVRSVWDKVAETNRAYFLLGILTEVTDPLGESLADFIIAALPETLAVSRQNRLYQIQQLASNKANAKTMLRVVDVLIEALPAEWQARVTRAQLLLELGRTDEAIREAFDVYWALRDEKSDTWKVQARERVVRAFAVSHLDEFLAAFDRRAAEIEPSVDLVNKRLYLIDRSQRREKSVDILRAAVEQFPKEKSFLQRLQRDYARQKRHIESLALLERMTEIEPDNAAHKQQLANLWRRLDHPIKQLRLKKEIEAQNEAKTQQTTTQPTTTTVTVSARAAGVMMALVVPARAATASATASRPKPPIQEIKQAIEKDDPDTARRALRRLWRNFTTPGRNPYRIIYLNRSTYVDLKWPRTPPTAAGRDDKEKKEPSDEQKAEARRKAGGGLLAYTDEEPPKPEPQPGAWPILAGHDFGIDEIRRLVRSRDGLELNQVQPIIAGLLKSRQSAESDEQIRDQLLALADDGRVGRLELMLLLILLDQRPEIITPQARSMLIDLLRAIDPADSKQLARLARMFARIGDGELAARIFSWCGTQAAVLPSYIYNRAAYLQPASPEQLIEDVRETLDKKLHVEIIDTILSFADPGDSIYTNREQYELLVMRTWQEMLAPDQALAKCRPILDKLPDLTLGIRRNAAKRGAALFARAGELDSAMKCLEIGLCSFKASELPTRFRYWADRPGSIGTADYRILFPAKSSDWNEPAEWFRSAATAMLDWADAGRIEPTRVIEAVALAAHRLSQAGDETAAQAIVQRLTALPAASAAQQLWIIDAARAAGLGTLASDLELGQLERNQLPTVRIAGVVRRILETRGPSQAIAAGDRFTEYTLDPELLDVLTDAARAGQDAEKVDRYERLAERASAARAELKQQAKNKARRAADAGKS